MRESLSLTASESRARLTPCLRDHAERLSSSLEPSGAAHREAGEQLARWFAANHRTGSPLHVIIVCTGNSRRSILGSSMGNLAAAFYGMPEIRFHSGGTEPTAFNSRTATALKAIGFDVVPTNRSGIGPPWPAPTCPRFPAWTSGPPSRLSAADSPFSSRGAQASTLVPFLTIRTRSFRAGRCRSGAGNPQR